MSRRKPTQLHKLQGTFRADRHAGNEPESHPASAALPRWAALDGEAEKCWRRLAPMLASMRVLLESDVHALVQLCRRYEEYMDLSEQIEKEGTTYVVDTGRYGRQIKQHPAVQHRDRAWADFQKGLTEFGMTPVSRSKITASPEPHDDPLSALLDGNPR